jgi:hypothetical protein
MPPTTHVVKGNFVTYELLIEVLGIIEQGIDAFTLLDD